MWQYLLHKETVHYYGSEREVSLAQISYMLVILMYVAPSTIMVDGIL